MSKKRLISYLLIGSFVFVMVSILVQIVQKNEKYVVHDGVMLAMTLTNGNQTTSIATFPDYSTGNYTVDVECKNAKGVWKPVKLSNFSYVWKLVIDEITGDVLCNLDFKTKIIDDNLNQYIIDNAVEGTIDGTGQGEGDIVHETFENSNGNTVDTGYRYEGKNPANYVWFNNELWRIIGVFKTELSDGTTKQLTKIVRADMLDALVWDINLSNNWPYSSLYKLLNEVEGEQNSGAYLKGVNGTNSGFCGKYVATAGNITVKGDCDYRVKGIGGTSSYYGSMLEEVVWYLGAFSSSSENTYASSASSWYKYEREEIVKETNDTQTIGYVGLMYGSDYGYSVKASTNCDRSTFLSKYNTNDCAGSSWLYSGYEWLINSRSDHISNVINIDHDGEVYAGSYGSYQRSYAIRPTVYLNETVYIVNGTGTALDPYIIAKEN